MPTSYRFTGQREDTTGLYFYNARYYDPVVGRFAQADTIVPIVGGRSDLSLPLVVSYAEPPMLEQLSRSHGQRAAGPSRSVPLDPQLLNRYTYVGNNPLARVDASGHAWWIVTGAIGGAVGLGAYAITHRDNFQWRDAALWTAAGAVTGATLGAGAELAAGIIGANATAAVGAASIPAVQTSINFLANNPQRIQHIMQAKHAWDRLVTLTGNAAKDYEAIQPIITQVIQTGQRMARGDSFVEYRSIINGQEVIVRGRELANKVFEISNAFIQTQ